MTTTPVISEKGKQLVDLPEAWKDVSTDQFIKIVKDWDGKDLIKLFSILTNIEYRAIFDYKDPVLEDALWRATRFIYEEPIDFKSLPIPDVFEFDGVTITVPKNIETLSIGQNIRLRIALDNATVNEEMIALAIAIYLQPKIDDAEFDFIRATEIEQKILKMPILETYGLGFFLLKRVTSSGRSFMKELNRVKILLLNRFRIAEKV